MKEELRNSLELIVSYTGMEYGGIYLLNEKNKEFYVEVFNGELVDREKSHFIEIPITSNEKHMGNLRLGSKETITLGEHMAILTNLSQQIGVHLENAKLYQHVQSTNDYLNSVIESSGDAIIISEFNGTIRSWNKGAEKIYGYSKEEAIGNYLPMVPKELQEEAINKMKLISQGKTLENWETKRITRSGELKDINVTASPLRDPNGNIVAVLGISKDISDNKKMEETIFKRNKELTLLNETALLLNQSFDRKDALQRALLKMREYLHLTGICLYERLPNETYQLIAHECNDRKENRQCSVWKNIIQDLEKILLKKDFYLIPSASNDKFPALIPLRSKEEIVGFLEILQDTNNLLDVEARKVLINFAHQIAVTLENKRLTNQVQQLAILKERERISMDLHDGVIQSLYGMGLKMEGFLDEEDILTIKKNLNDSIDNLNHVIQDIRNYIFRLRSNQLQNRPLSACLNDLAHSTKINYLIETVTSIDPSLDMHLSDTQVDHIVHIVKEALSNIIKHSKATNLGIQLNQEEDSLRLNISDNGIGFVPDMDKETGQGLTNMEERAKKINGKLSITSQPLRGTQITLLVPVFFHIH